MLIVTFARGSLKHGRHTGHDTLHHLAAGLHLFHGLIAGYFPGEGNAFLLGLVALAAGT
jgi:hypothetical protein